MTRFYGTLFRTDSLQSVQILQYPEDCQAGLRKAFQGVVQRNHDRIPRDVEGGSRIAGTFYGSGTITEKRQWYREISGTTISDGRVFCIVNGMDKTSYLAEYNKVTGGFRRLSGFTSYSSRIKAHDGRIWWSESIPDSRWSLEMTSRIRYYDISTGKSGT